MQSYLDHSVCWLYINTNCLTSFRKEADILQIAWGSSYRSGQSRANVINLVYFKDFILYFREGKGRERERDRSIDVRGKHWSVASCTPPNWGPGPKPRYAPWRGIEPATFQFAGWHSSCWATPARANLTYFKCIILYVVVVSAKEFVNYN